MRNGGCHSRIRKLNRPQVMRKLQAPAPHVQKMLPRMKHMTCRICLSDQWSELFLTLHPWLGYGCLAHPLCMSITGATQQMNPACFCMPRSVQVHGTIFLGLDIPHLVRTRVRRKGKWRLTQASPRHGALPLSLTSTTGLQSALLKILTPQHDL